MVSTRRSTANTGPARDGTTKLNFTASTNDTIHVRKSSKNIGHLPITPKIASAALKTTPSGNISEHDLSLTSPFTEETLETNTLGKPRRKFGSPVLPERSLSSALRRLAPKPFGNMSGSSHNPIILTEDSPPRLARAPKRKNRHRRLPEQRQFMGKGHGDVYSYHASRSALEPLPANGNTFTGHQTHDIYRMMNAKLIAAPEWNPNAAWGRHTQNVPFEVQYPISAQFLAQQQRTASQTPYTSPYPQYHQYQAPPTKYTTVPTVPAMNEDMLRKKVVQYIREYSKQSLRKRRLSDADPDETSASELDQPATAAPNAVPFRQDDKTMVYRNDDSDFNINHLVEHTSLITSLLLIYPHSVDQKGLREDISLMVSMQNQHVTKWMKDESQCSRKRRKSSSNSVVSVGSIGQVATTAARYQKEQDDALRQVFSANAEMWQDGTGCGVADVFTALRSSSPAIGAEDDHPDLDGETVGVNKEATAVGIDVVISGRPLSNSKDGSLDPVIQSVNASKALQNASMSPTSNNPGHIAISVEANHEPSIPASKPALPNGKPTSPSLDELAKDAQSSRSNKDDETITPTRKITPLSTRHSKTPSSSLPSKVNSPSNKTSATESLGTDKQVSVPPLVRQDATSSMEKVDEEYRILKERYLETNGVGEGIL